MNQASKILQFLVRSDNRMAVLMILTSGVSPTRPELQRKTQLPRSTVSRILSELGDRDLVLRAGSRYEATPFGRIVAERLDTVCNSIEAIQRLQTVLTPLSNSDLVFSDQQPSEILPLTSSDPNAPTRRFTDLLHAASRIHLLVPGVIPVLLEMSTAINHSNRTVEVVIPRVAFEKDSNYIMRQQLRDLVETDDITLFSYDGDVPYFAGTIDTIALIGMTTIAGTIQGLVVTTDETVRSSIEAIIQAYYQNADCVNPTDLTS